MDTGTDFIKRAEKAQQDQQAYSLNLAYSGIHSPSAILELNNENERLKQENEQLKAEIARLQAASAEA